METISIVRGNDFRLRIPLRRHVIQPDGSVVPDDFDPATVDVMKVFLEGADCVRELPWVEDDEHDSSIVCDVDGLTPLGSYHLIVAGKRDGVKFRSKERRQFRIVDNNERANIWPTQYDGFEAYVLDTMIILDARGRDGLSAYEIAVVNGFSGTETQWLKSLAIKSIVKTGTNDLTDTYTITYSNGTTSTFDLQNGEGTYHMAVRLGLFSGTEAEWAERMMYPDLSEAVAYHLRTLEAAINGVSAEMGEDDGGDPDVTAELGEGPLKFTFKNLKGEKGDKGETGQQGPQGDSVVVGQGDLPLAHVLGGDNTKAISQKGATDAMKKMVDFTGEEFQLQYSSYSTNDCSVGSEGKWYRNGSSGPQRHYAIPVVPGQKYRIENSDSSAGLRYAFVTSEYNPPYSNNGTVPVASGQNKAVSAGTSSIVTAPTDAAYLCINKIAGAGDEIPSNLYYVGSQAVGGIEYRNPVEIDLSEAVEHPCSHGTDKWYRSGSTGDQRHIAIAVTPGKTYKIRVKEGGSFAAVLTESYDPDTTYTTNTPLQLASCNNERIVVQGWRYITIPNDGVYLTMTTNQGGNQWSWEVYEVTPVEVGVTDAPKDVPVKIRVMQWNVGNWAMGGPEPTLSPAEFETKKMLYRQMIDNAAADVICCCEWEEYVDTESQGKAKDVLFGNYDSFIQSPAEGRYMQTAILSNGLKLIRIQRTTYEHSALSGGNKRYYSTATFRINGHDVKIVATHLDSRYSGNDPDYADQCREEQMETLIEAFAEDQYVILCADWNVADRPEEYEIFKDAGYDMANCGYLGILDTFHRITDNRDDLPIDNIIFKGFKGSKIEVYDKYNPELPIPNRQLSDHSPIAVTLTMIE